jgi:polyisoprenoid-binding protein YceI
MRKTIHFWLSAAVLTLGVLVSPRLYAEEYSIDPAHSSVGFTTTHMMVSRVSGQFDQFAGTVNFDPNNLDASKVDITVQTGSINTHNDKRDGHLKSGDFFDAGKFPTITFVSKKIAKEGDKYNVTGDLTIKGVTKEATFSTTINGPVKSPMGGGSVIGVDATGKINRQDFGVNWNKTMDNGGVMVSDDVDLHISLEAHQKEESKDATKKEESKETK